MYIISKQKDYYDGVVGTMGIDKTIVYERKIIEIEDQTKFPKTFQGKSFWHRQHTNHFLNLEWYDTDSKKYEACSSFIVGFCGKLYLGWKFYYIVNNRYNNELKTDIIYGFENAKKHLIKNRWNTNIVDDIEYIQHYNPIELFREINAPIFIYDSDFERFDLKQYRSHSKFIINPILKDYEFYKVIDTYTAFQEIQMFISGVLGIGESEIVEIEDKYKIPQHGFDKWSFRRESTKKKK